MILLIEVIEHLDDVSLESVLIDCKRLLKPNGVLLISTPNDEVLEDSTQVCPDCGAYFHSVQHIRNWNYQSLQVVLNKYGLTCKKCVTTNLLSEKTFLKTLVSRIYNFLIKVLRVKNSNLIVMATHL